MKTRSSEFYIANPTGITMTRRRSLLEIQVAILDAIAQGNDKPTVIMYSANLSWLILQNTLLKLESNGLINKDILKNRSVYSVMNQSLDTLRICFYICSS